MKAIFINILKNKNYHLPIIFGAAFLITLPILIWGVPYGYDMPHHYQCALTYLEAIKSGDFYPSWTIDRNMGFGALELRMYPPLSHFILALFELLLNNWHLASWANYTFWWTLGGFGFYLLAREFVKPSAALAASLLFSIMPYRISQLYLTFLFSELCAIAVLPFCFLFLTRIIKENNAHHTENTLFARNPFLSPNIIGFSISYSALILTHLPLTVIGTVSLGVYFLFQTSWNFRKLSSNLISSGLGAIIALLATSFFWIKVIQERALMAKNEIYPEIFVEYKFNFLFTFLQTYDDFSIEVYRGITQAYDIILLITVLMALPLGIIGFSAIKKDFRKSYRSIGLTLSFTIFITTILSKPLWDFLPLLKEVQFSWRFLGVVSIFAALFAALGISKTYEWVTAHKNKYILLTTFSLLFLGSLFTLSQGINGAVYKSPSEMNDYVSDVGQKEGFKFWWTIRARKEIFNDKEKVRTENRTVQIEKWSATEKEFLVSEGETDYARIAVFYHPNWNAYVNDTPTDIASDPNGAVLIRLANQKSHVLLIFKEPSSVKLLQWLSGIMWLGLISLLLIQIANKYKLNRLSLLSGI